METFVVYIIKSTIGLSLFYLFYRLFLANDTDFRKVRVFLLLSIFFALTLPLSWYSIPIEFTKKSETEKITVNTFIQQNSISETSITEVPVIADIETIPEVKAKIDWLKLLLLGYFIITFILISRLLLHLSIIIINYIRSQKRYFNTYTLVINSNIKNSFSIFKCVFINNRDLQDEELNKIIAHETIHVSQYHSVDNITIELLAAVMWFNPVVWLFRNSVQLIHEYLADEGALGTGLDKLQYQALLINRVAEEKLICLSSGFNHSLIKKRIVMMTKSKFDQSTKLKIFALVPISILFFLGVSLVNGQTIKNPPPESNVKMPAKKVVVNVTKQQQPKDKTIKEETKKVVLDKKVILVDEAELAEIQEPVVSAVAPVKMNVLYLGVENPVDIAVSNYNPEEITVTIDNGTIKNTGNSYLIRPSRVGLAMITVFAGNKKVRRAEFRVKSIPNPISKVAGLKSGKISKENLINAGEVIADLENFDFEVNFTIVSFTVSSTIQKNESSFDIVKVSKSDKFTNEQKDFIKTLPVGNKVYITEINAIDPNGTERELNGIIFTIVE